jgi:hypothetical protein
LNLLGPQGLDNLGEQVVAAGVAGSFPALDGRHWILDGG